MTTTQARRTRLRLARPCALLATALALAPLGARADEGMWLPEQVPLLADQLRTQGIQLDPQQLGTLGGDPLGAIVALIAGGGCSASFVSADGLVITNHHCVSSLLQLDSTPERDLIDRGYLATTRADELPGGPASRIYVPLSTADVTKSVVGGLAAKLSDLDRQKEIEAREKRLVAGCEQPGGVRCRIAARWGGVRYDLIAQEEIRDVRLVYAPANAIGEYGGEVDNWMWPRHTGDFGFLRAYVGADGKPADYAKDNVPYKPAHWLRPSTGDLDPGDAVIVAGFPGRTERYRTAAEVRDDVATGLPGAIRIQRELIAALEKENARSRAVALANADAMEAYENFAKKDEGTLAAFERDALVPRLERQERELPAKLGGAAGAGLRDAVAGIDTQLARGRATAHRDLVLAYMGRASHLLGQATTLWKLALERPKPDAERELGYQERDARSLEGRVRRAQASMEPGSDRAALRVMLREADALPATERIEALDRLLAATGAATPEARIEALLDRLYATTKLGELDQRLAMMKETTAQLAARHDPMLELAAALRPLLDANRQRDREVEGALSRLRPQYEAALVQAAGGRLAPDADFTLRVSFGKVEGYSPRDGMEALSQTTVRGLLAKETGKDPFASPPALLAAVRAGELGPYVDPDLGTVPVAFLSSVDITNGSSGSATLDARGRLVGLAFDANVESMASDYVVDPQWTRAIHVDMRYVLWVMDRIDHADALLREMGVEPSFAAATSSTKR